MARNMNGAIKTWSDGFKSAWKRLGRSSKAEWRGTKSTKVLDVCM